MGQPSGKGIRVGAVQRGVKNTFRNSIRTVGIVVILAVAIALSISMLIARSAVDHKIDAVRSNTGTTITVSPAGFFGFSGGGNPLTASQISKISALPDVTKVTSSLSQTLSSSDTSLTAPTPSGFLGHHNGGQFFGGGGSSFSSNFTPPIRVVGTNSPSTALVGGASGGGTETLVKGKSYAANSTADVAILGKALASKNDLAVGDTFTAWNTKITVIGIYNAQSTFANDEVLMPLATVQKLTDETGDVTGATVYVNNVGNVAGVQKKINSLLGSKGSATSESSIVANELAPLKDVQSISTYTLIGTAVGAGLILLLSMLMIVRERRREIGVLKALGASNGSVIRQFISESTTFTVLGMVFGLGLGVLLGAPITSALVKNSSNSSSAGGFPGGFQRFGGSGTFPRSGSGLHFTGGAFANAVSQVHASAGWSTIVFAILVALAVAIIGSSVAVATVVRIRPAEVLRSE